MSVIELPEVKEVAGALEAHKEYFRTPGREDDSFEVRLQVWADGSWALHTGDPSYDTDHTGYWGASGMDKDTDCEELARELIDEAAEHAAQCGEDEEP